MLMIVVSSAFIIHNEEKVKLCIHTAYIACIFLYTNKFAQDASARRMPRYAHGNKSGAY